MLKKKIFCYNLYCLNLISLFIVTNTYFTKKDRLYKLTETHSFSNQTLDANIEHDIKSTVH